MRPTLYAFATAQLDGLLAQNELDLAGLLEPFQVTNVRVTDTAHQSHLITALPLHIVEARTQPRPESTEHFIDSLDSLVHRAAAGDIPPPLQVAAPTRAADAGNEGWKGRPVESITPWFAVMRDHVLHKRDLVEYETFACPVACLLAISTADPDPLSTLADLWDRTSKDNLFPPASTIADEDYKSEWINPEVLRYILLVHDSSAGGGRDALEEAQRLHEKVIKTYGSHTTLLPLFSASPTSINPLARSSKVPSLWRLPRPSPGSEPTQMQKGENLSDQDLQGIDKFMREMVVQSIVPFMERTILISNEQFIASKRSIGGRLFSAGRKYFGASASSSASGSRTGSPLQGTTGVMNGGCNVTRGYYPFTTQEAQTRRLADFAFMLEDFRLAVTVYDSLSKDFKIDRAWRYYAAACRMVGLSQLRLHPTGTPLTFNPDLSLESAMDIGGGASIERSLQGAAGVDFDGLRAVLLYYDAYRAIGDWRAAERGLVRQAGEMEEITSAVLLEQAAIANLNLPRCSRRKFAFWMILAGERYEKCGLKILSRRCLSQAASVYAFSPSDDVSDVDPGWDQIQSRLFIKLARQAYNSGKYVEAVNWFLQVPFRAPEAVTDVQDEMRGEREAWLEDFALAWDHLSPESTKTFCDENPNKWEGVFFDPNRVSIRVGLAEESDALDRAGYADLLTAFGNAVAGRGVQVKRTGNEVVIGQTFYLELYASNPLDEQITLGGLQVLTDASETERGKIEVGLPTDIVLEAREVRRVMLAIVSRSLVPFTFTSLSFTFAKLLPLSSTLRKAPRRLTSTRAQLIEPTYSLPADDTSLLVRMIEPIPVLSVSFVGVRERVYEGETVRGWLELGNLGGAVMQGLKGLCSEPWVLELVQSAEEIYTPGEGGKEHVVVDNRIRGNEPFVVPLLASGLAPSGLVKVPVVLRGMHRGDHLLRFVFQFVGPDVKKTLSWRGSFRVCVEPSIRIEPSLRASNSFTNPYLLGLEISNSFQGTEVSIDQISSLSPRWEIAALGNSSSTPARLDISTLLPRQSESFFCTVRPSSSFDPAPSLASTAFVARKVEALLSGKDFKGSFLGSIGLEASSISSPKQGIQLGAEVLRDSIVKSLRQGRREELDRQLSSLEKGFHEHLFPLISTTELILVIFYSFLSPNSALRRQGHLLLSLPISARTNILKEVIEKAELKAGGIYAQSQRERITLLDSLRRSEWGAEECPALIGVRVSEILEWNFEQEPCALPLVFTLRNISTTLSFSYILRLTTPSTASSSSTTLFAGPLSFTGQCLPLGTTTVNSSLWIPREGSFDIGQRWHVEINALDCAGLVVGSWTKQGERSLVRARQSDAGRIEDRSLLDEPVAAT